MRVGLHTQHSRQPERCNNLLGCCAVVVEIAVEVELFRVVVDAALRDERAQGIANALLCSNYYLRSMLLSWCNDLDSGIKKVIPLLQCSWWLSERESRRQQSKGEERKR